MNDIFTSFWKWAGYGFIVVLFALGVLIKCEHGKEKHKIKKRPKSLLVVK